MRPARLGSLCWLTFALNGCTTLSSGIVSAPPGINKYSFRECLLHNGFYSPHALTGQALTDDNLRHQHDGKDKKAKALPSDKELLEESGPAFVARAGAIIANGLMPSLEYVSPDMKAQHANTNVPASNAYDYDHGVGLPYGPMPSPGPYNAANRVSAGVLPGSDWRLNRFLDCYVSEVGPADDTSSGNATAGDTPPGNVTAGDLDVEGRLLRAHILLTLIAQYGTELIVSRPSSRQVAQAELLLGHVADAEKSLRSASLILNSALLYPDGKAQTAVAELKNGTGSAVYSGGTFLLAGTDGKPTIGVNGKTTPVDNVTLTVHDVRGTIQPDLYWFRYTTRLLRVFQVGVDVERIDGQQTLDRASNLIAAFSGSVAGFLPILKDGLSGFVTVQKTRIYGDAYLRDARETLRVTRGVTTPTSDGMSYDAARIVAGWKLWDGQLNNACTVLATVAKKDDTSAQCAVDLAAPATTS